MDKDHSPRNNVVGLGFSIQRLAALVGLLLISPVLLGVWLTIRLESKGPALFRQIRVGLHGRRFELYKFRSMYLPEDPRFKAPDVNHSDREGICAKYRKDPRITRVGQVIRKFSIDELPQLLNVLKGDMALVGPRPALVNEVEAYDCTALNRLNTMPGLTGLWQISGRADTTFEEQVRLDLEYIAKQNWLFDFFILLRTVPAVVSGKGAY